MTQQPRDLYIGRTIGRTYLVTQRIGAGGMGFLYKALNTKLNQTVALKFITNPEDPAVAKRFAQEAKALAALVHPNIVGVKSLNADEPGECFIVMEYLQGKDLSAVLKESGTLSKEQFTAIFEQVVRGLSFAHSRGIIHRDLKPSNIMLVTNADGTQTAKILDFGLAKIGVSARTQALTATGTVFGSPNYMSPEQCAGKKVDARSDVYSLACVMHQMLSGKVPFESESAIQTIYKHAHETLPPLAGDGLQALSTILQSATSVDARRRFASVDDLWAAIQADKPVAVTRQRTKLPLTWAGCIVRWPPIFILFVILGLAVVVTMYVMGIVEQSRAQLQMESYTDLAKSGRFVELASNLQKLEHDPRIDATLARSLRDDCFTWAQAQKDPALKARFGNLMIDFGKMVVDKRRKDAPQRQTASETLYLNSLMTQLGLLNRQLEVLNHELKFSQAYDSPTHSMQLFMLHGALVEPSNPTLAATDYNWAMACAQEEVKARPTPAAVAVLTRTVDRLAAIELQQGDYKSVITNVTDWMRLTDLSAQDIAVSNSETPQADTKAQMEIYLGLAYDHTGNRAQAADHWKEAISIARSALEEKPDATSQATLHAQIRAAEAALAVPAAAMHK